MLNLHPQYTQRRAMLPLNKRPLWHRLTWPCANSGTHLWLKLSPVSLAQAETASRAIPIFCQRWGCCRELGFPWKWHQVVLKVTTYPTEVRSYTERLNCPCWAYRRSCLFPPPTHPPPSSPYPTPRAASGHGQNKAWVMPCLVLLRLRLRAHQGPSPAESQYLISEAITESVTPSTDTIITEEKLNSLQASDRKTKLYNNRAPSPLQSEAATEKAAKASYWWHHQTLIACL